MSSAIDWNIISEEDMYNLENRIKDERKKRCEEKSQKIQKESMIKLLKIWPNIQKESGSVIVEKLEKTDIDGTFEFRIIPVHTIKDDYARQPPYRVRLEYHTYKGTTKYNVHISLNCTNDCSSSGMNWYNFASPDGNNDAEMGPHWQFKNKRELPQDFKNIPMIRDLLSDYYNVMTQLFE